MLTEIVLGVLLSWSLSSMGSVGIVVRVGSPAASLVEACCPWFVPSCAVLFFFAFFQGDVGGRSVGLAVAERSW